MIIKTPPVYDISHWKEVADFKAIAPRPVLMITKATEGVTLVDSKFVRFFDGMKQAGYHRGAFHFNRKAYDGAGQARHFINVVSGYITDNDLLILDVEEGGEKASQLWAWFETVRARFPRNTLLLYSRRDILEQIVMTYGEKEYFKRVMTWMAGYPTNPDLFDEIPNAYIADPTRFGQCVLWQYSAHGAVSGIVGDVDLNWIDPTFAESLGVVPDEPPTQEQGMKEGTVVTTKLNIRQGPGKGYADIGDLFAGDKVYGEIDTATGWFFFNKIVRKTGAVEVMSAWCAVTDEYGVQCLSPRDVTTTPPATVKTPFTLSVDGYKPFSGELEKA